jgi:hypothetical protein
MEQILTVEPARLNEEQQALFYAQSWLLTHYFYSTPERSAALGRFLAATRRGEAPIEALHDSLGMTPDELTHDLRRYIRDNSIRYHQMRRSSDRAPAQVTITDEPDSADDLMIYDGALRVDIAQADREAALARIRAFAARFPRDPYAMRIHGEAEALYGDPAVADRLLDVLLAAYPHDAQLLYLKGMRYLAAADRSGSGETLATARGWFARAEHADSNHFQSLYRYAETLRGEPAYRTRNTQNVMLLAHQLAPQVAEISINAAQLLISMNEIPDALALLSPLAVDPHDKSLANAARQLMADARAQAAARSNTHPPVEESEH